MTLALLSLTVGVVECIGDDVDLSSELKYTVFWTRERRLCVYVCGQSINYQHNQPVCVCAYVYIMTA